MIKSLRFSLVGASLLAILAVFAPSALAAGPFYASPTGSGTTCTQEAPCALGEAVSKGNSNMGSVVIGPGTYSLSGSLFVFQPIDVGGQVGKPAPVLLSTGASSVSVSNPGAHFHDVRVEGGGEVAIFSAVADRIFVSSTGGGLNHAACYLGSGATLRNSVCWSHDGASNNSAIREQVLVGSTVPPVILRNDTAITTAAAAPAIQLELLANGAKATIEATNVIARSANHADVEALVSSASNTTGTVALNHSNYGTVKMEGAGTTVTAPGTNTNQTGFPTFVGPATGDFREVAGSPTIDAGIGSVLEDTVDLVGNPRTQPACIGGAGISDIGAYEIAPVSCAGPAAAPSNKFKLGKLKLNKKKGTATLAVTVPGAGTLTLSGKGVKKVSRSSKGPETLKLSVKALGKAKKGLGKTGKAKLKVKLTFVPSGGVAAQQTQKVKLVEKLP